jgi:rubrerythrin
MKIWMTTEIQSDVSNAYDTCRRNVERIFNEYFREKFYGDGLVKIFYLAIIREVEVEGYKEVKRYHKKDCDAEFRLRISHDEFLHANEKEQLKMVTDSVMRAIKLISELKKIPDFDYSAFEQDAIKLWQENGWIKAG